ncbi:MAG: GDSL-type esterase/lipase family protein [Planctomycetota bacterium]
MKFLALLLPLLLCGSSQPDTAISIFMDDANIRYTGRWDHSDPLAPWCSWQGSSLTVNFQGSGILLDIDVGDNTEWFRVVIDEDHANSRKIPITPGRKWITLAGGLSSGTHRLDLIKETYVSGRITVYEMHVRGLGLTTPPPPRPRRIEFYGDSNLAGYSLEHEENNGSSKYIGVHFGFSGVLARRMNAEYHNISASGENLRGTISRFDRVRRFGDFPQWDFQRFTPDVVIVNIGANDVGRDEPGIRNDYHTLLDQLRAVHPLAHIVVANARGWSFDEPANFTPDVVAQRQDPNMSWVHFPWVFESGHACESDQAGFAEVLARHLEHELGWTPLPSDVLIGIGLDGDIANGGFEGTAPFGGYAWRYRSDPRTTRIKNAQQAFEGNAFLRLWNGGSTHQPVPATNGDVVEVACWMRGQGSATVTIDFRNQEMFSAPLHAVDHVVQLQPQWTRVTMQVPAPLGTPRPIFHTRLTFTADAGSGCDVDAVQMRLR